MRVAACGFDDLRCSTTPILRNDEIGQIASVVSAHPLVRAALTAAAEAVCAAGPGGAVLDGRDIGTVIAPEADRQALREGDPAESARAAAIPSCKAKGSTLSLDKVLADIRKRDERDSSRSVRAPRPWRRMRC